MWPYACIDTNCSTSIRFIHTMQRTNNKAYHNEDTFTHDSTHICEMKHAI
jgi:hypothetical protein